MTAAQASFGFAAERRVSRAEMEAEIGRLRARIEATVTRMQQQGVRATAIAEETALERQLLARLESLVVED